MYIARAEGGPLTKGQAAFGAAPRTQSGPGADPASDKRGVPPHAPAAPRASWPRSRLSRPQNSVRRRGEAPSADVSFRGKGILG